MEIMVLLYGPQKTTICKTLHQVWNQYQLSYALGLDPVVEQPTKN